MTGRAGAPLIGFVTDRKVSSSGAWQRILTDGIPHSYPRAVELAGGAPLLFPALETHLADPGRLLDRIDGLLLPGGRDLDAALYGQEAHVENDPPLRVRDELEIALAREAIRRGIPVLGICRGLQVLNVALGGSLVQHLGDTTDPVPHRDLVGTFTAHPVEIRNGTRLRRIIGSPRIEIASHHHQSVGVLGAGLVATAFAPDGVIEAAETDDGSFVVGVQWHPEERLDPESLRLLRALVDAARPTVA
ncbi:gamma-glutamyl-gamma-aminobutyrate hydrolase [Leucobacter iarius]|uniref:Gamma-glutamyl-gamma-aminobutyrate hydrolase n=1 Tax=Leucobacter iarius TaxID=333963 RepID=A0ABP4XII3_9MICO